MTINLGQEEKQRLPGPVPGGSMALVKITLAEAKTPDCPDTPYIGVGGSTGLLFLACKMEVQGGPYEGVTWWENITLPISSQTIDVSQDPNWQKACRIGGRLLRAILESARRVTPSDTSSGAEKKRQIQSWKEIDGLMFAAELGVYEDTYQRDRSGRTWYRNNIRRVICQGHPRYAAIMRRNFFLGTESVPRRDLYQPQPQAASGGWEDFPPEGF